MTDLKIAPRNLSEKQNYHLFMLNVNVYKGISIFFFSHAHLCLDANKKQRNLINSELEAECSFMGPGGGRSGHSQYCISEKLKYITIVFEFLHCKCIIM